MRKSDTGRLSPVAGGLLSMISAIGSQAVLDAQTTSDRMRPHRDDAKRFFMDGRFEIVCRLVGGVSVPAAQSILRKRGIIGGSDAE